MYSSCKSVLDSCLYNRQLDKERISELEKAIDGHKQRHEAITDGGSGVSMGTLLPARDDFDWRVSNVEVMRQQRTMMGLEEEERWNIEMLCYQAFFSLQTLLTISEQKIEQRILSPSLDVSPIARGINISAVSLPGYHEVSPTRKRRHSVKHRSGSLTQRGRAGDSRNFSSPLSLLRGGQV